MAWLKELGMQGRGSRPRCVLLCDGSTDQVARRLTELVDRPAVEVLAGDHNWQPQGKTNVHEAELDKENAVTLLDDSTRHTLREWWLANGNAKTPSWDIASTCTILGQQGLLLIEAKAHSNELSPGDSCAAKKGTPNRKQIEGAIAEANDGLLDSTGGSWALSSEHHYQLSNRFAWSWKLAALGVPTVLIYLGFINANDVADMGTPFRSSGDWKNAVLNYSSDVIDPDCWERILDIKGTPVLPLIRSCEQSFDPESEMLS